MSPILDRDGRLFGRLNIIDAALIAVATVTLPLLYGAYLLFRIPDPEITSVEPAQLSHVEERAAAGSPLSAKLKVRGRNLRPVLRATVGGRDAIAFIFENPTSADVLMGELPPGTHDLVLYDGVQEVARASNAVAIKSETESTSARVRVIGRLFDLDEATAKSLRVGTRYPETGTPAAQIVALGEPTPDVRDVRVPEGIIELAAEGRWQRDAAVVIACDVTAPLQCRADSGALSPDTVLPIPGSGGALRLRIHSMVPAQAPLPADALVRFFVPAEAAELITVGDRDISAPAVDDRVATIVSIQRRATVSGDVTMPSVVTGAHLPTSVTTTDQIATVDAVVRLGLDAARDGWRYRSQRLSVGLPLTFVTPDYTVRGLVRRVDVQNGAKRPE